MRTHGLEDRVERVVPDSISEGYVDRVAFSPAHADVLNSESERAIPRRAATYPYIASTREELAKSVKAGRHDSVGGIERLLYAVTMMDVHIDVQDARMYPSHKFEPEFHENLISAHRSNSNIPKTLSSEVRQRKAFRRKFNAHVIHVAEPTRFGLFRVM